MNTRNTNVIDYVKQTLRQGQTREISDTIGALHGVANAHNSRRTERIIFVDYDPGIIDSQHILQSVRDQGVTARLVGV
jgi:hypothetical protein